MKTMEKIKVEHRIAIVDDDRLFADQLATMVVGLYARHEVAHTIHRYGSANDLLEALQTGCQYDIMFLDIVMGDLNGISLAEKIRAMGIQAIIVFVTSTKEYALEGYRVLALQYLLKPVQETELEALFETAYALIKSRRSGGSLLIHTRQDYRRIPYDEIEYIEQVNRKAVVHTFTKTLGSDRTLRELHQTLPQNIFLRCHQGYVVNLQQVASLSASHLKLRNGTSLPVSRSHAKEMKIAFFDRHFADGAK